MVLLAQALFWMLQVFPSQCARKGTFSLVLAGSFHQSAVSPQLHFSSPSSGEDATLVQIVHSDGSHNARRRTEGSPRRVFQAIHCDVGRSAVRQGQGTPNHHQFLVGLREAD